MQITVQSLAEKLGAEFAGSGQCLLNGISGVENADVTDVTFAIEERIVAKLHYSEAAAVIVDHYVQDISMHQLIVPDVSKSLIRTIEIFAPQYTTPPAVIDPTAKIAQNAQIGKNVTVGPFAILSDGCRIGHNTVIGDGCRIGQETKIGNNCRLDSNVKIYENCTLGNNVTIQANTVIGSMGFGYYLIDGNHKLIPHIGTVIIEDFVEIGANCCIDRAKFDATRIGAGTKLDNLVQIGHNAIIGKCCLIAGLTGISGSSKIGDGVVMGGQVGISDHITIGDGVMIGAKAGVLRDFAPGKRAFGYPATELKQALKSISLTNRLPELHTRLRQAEKQLKEIKEVVTVH
jgi:UDP-3-O-[3-hydroxymyristoyl] glucosamine N-acyltransferase